MIKKGLQVLIVLWVGLSGAIAQTPEEKVIHFKQRFLRPKSQSDELGKQDSLRTLHLMIAGNVYQTEKHINYCYNESTGKYNFRDELKYIQPIISLGDLAIANLKTSFGGNMSNMFSAPDEFALALKYSGINAVVHANLHTAHIDRLTFQRTRELMNEFNIRYTGAFTDNFQRTGNYPLIIEKKGFRIALLNYGTIEQRPEISNNFYINEIDRSQIEKDMRMAIANRPDYIIVYFDWGAERQDIPSYNQVDLARFCFQQGADLVVGTHPNAPMRLDYVNYYRNGQSKEGIVAYSLGNLIASNDDVRNRNGYLMDIELHKNNYTGEVKMGDWGVIPVYTYYDTINTGGLTKVYSVPCSAVESGDILRSLPYIEKRRVINGAYEVRKLLGTTADEIQYNLTEQVASNVMETIDLTNAAWNNKFATTRPTQVKPSDAPVLPVASMGTNNPPSISKIYGDEPPATTDKTTTAATAAKQPPLSRLEEARRKAEQVFLNNNAPNLNTGLGTATGPLKTETENPGTPMAETVVPAAPTETNNTSVAANASPSGNATAAPAAEKSTAAATPQPTNSTEEAATANKTTTLPNNNNAPPKAKTNAADEEEALRKKTAAVNDEEEAARKKTAAVNNTANNPPKQPAPPTAVNSQPKETELPPRAEARPVKLETRESGNLNSGPVEAMQANLTPVEGKGMSLVYDTSYRVQFYALKRYLPLDTNYYTHLKGFEVVEEDGLFKYMLGKFKTYEECHAYWTKYIQPRYKESFVVKFVRGKRVIE